MPKRSRSSSSSQGRRTFPGRSNGRGWHGGLPTPVTPRPRLSGVKLPPKFALRGISRAAKMMGPYGRVASLGLDAYDAYTSAKDSVNRAKSFFNTPMAKKKSKGSHYNSKSAGFFGGTSKNINSVDKHAKMGVVQRYEYGGVKTDSSNQVVYLAHSTCPADSIARACFSSLLKKLFMANQVQVRSHGSLLLENCAYDNSIILFHRLRDNDAILQFTIAVPRATATLETVTTSMFNFFDAFRANGQVPDQILRLQLLDNANSTFVSPVVVATLNLTNTTFTVDIKSSLKIQNRTINTTGNNEADDVDNVPIQGRFFDYNTNGTIYNDYATGSGTSAVTTHAVYGVLPTTAVVTTGTSMFQDLPMQKQFAGCKKSGKALLDPGEIKTSVISDHVTLSLQYMIKLLFSKTAGVVVAGGIECTQYWVGKTRLFAWEKLIHAVEMSATNQFNLAYEHQLDIGASCAVKRDNLTAAYVKIATSGI